MARTKRDSVSPSLRWSVFARDGFTCRYCGAKAGEPGVSLHADHIKSLAEGGATTYENLLTACGRCNGGKGARSLLKVPDSGEVAARMQERAESIKLQAEAVASALEQEKHLQQQSINLKCEAYETESVKMQPGETGHIIRLCREYGAENVLDWYRCAYSHNVSEWAAIRYVYGIIRNLRKQQEGENA